MNVFLHPLSNWDVAAALLAMAGKFLMYRWQVKSLRRSVGELRAERTRLEALVAELKQILSRP